MSKKIFIKSKTKKYIHKRIINIYNYLKDYEKNYKQLVNFINKINSKNIKIILKFNND